MRNIIILLLIAGLGYLIFYNAYFDKLQEPDKLEALKEKYAERPKKELDHSILPALQRKFKSPEEVTLTCISCHAERHKEIMKNNHWLWEREDFIEGRGVTYLGKKNAINNFCINISGSEQACNRCHIGYGFKDETFNFHDSSKVDCLVCHATPETYRKGKSMAGYPDPSVDLTAAAQSVGKPTRYNCGSCHFFGGGGNNVKHGDLEKALFTPTKDVDVHLAQDGANLECVDCHTAERHQIKGRMYSLSSTNINRLYCEDCHTATPHKKEILNEHTYKVACQTCHIPIYAKVNKTKVYWDWSTAGKLKNGKPYAVEDDEGYDTYLSIKGSFVWKRNLKPDYVWFNGTAQHYFPCDKADTNKVIKLNTLNGSYADKNSKIIPVKIMRTRQIYDIDRQHIITPRLFSSEKGQGAYWKDFNWEKAAEAGMLSLKKMLRLEYPNDSCFSGHYTFVNTESFWPLNHMVSPKEKSVKCEECHTPNNGRLAKLTGFYMPGRDRSSWIDNLGILIIVLSFAGVLVHGGIRIYYHYKINNNK